MKWFYDLKIGVKLFISFAIMALIAGVIGYYGIRNIQTIDKSYNEMYENQTKPLATIGDVAIAFQRIRVNLRDLLLEENVANSDKYVKTIAGLDTELNDDLAVFEKTIVKEELRKEVDHLKAAMSKYGLVQDKIVSLILEGKKEEAHELLKANTELALEVDDSIGKTFDLKIATAKEISETNTAMAANTVKSMGIILGFGIMIAVLLGIFISRIIGNPLTTLSKVADKLAVGDVNVTIEADTDDEVGMLGRSFKAMVDGIRTSAMALEKIANGDMNIAIATRSQNDILNINLLNVTNAVKLLINDANMLSKAAVEGKLATRADATKHAGDYRKIVEGVNDTLDAVIGPLNVAADYVEKISKGNIPAKITDTYNGDFNTIKNNLNACIDAVNLLVADANLLSKAAVDGKLATRADATKHAGDFRKIVEGVNDTLNAVIGPLNVAADYVDKISKGNIPAKITDKYNGDFNTIKNNLNACIDAVNLLVADANMLSKAAVEGKLETRADATKHWGDFRKIVEGVNETLNSVIGPLNVAADYVDKISKGNIPAKITDRYNGDFNTIKNNLNACIDAVNLLVADANMLSKAAVEGKLATRADATKHWGDFRKIVEGVNETLNSVIGPLNVAADYVEKISKGNMPSKITDTYNGDFNTIKNNLNACIDAINLLIADANMLAKAAVEGKLNTRADAAKHWGDFRKIVEGVNGTLNAVIGPLNVAAEYVDKISKGNVPARITDTYYGDFNTLKSNINLMIDYLTEMSNIADSIAAGNLSIKVDPKSANDNLGNSMVVLKNNVQSLVVETTELAKAGTEGRLKVRGNADKFQGGYRDVIKGINDTMDAIINPVTETSECMKEMAKGNLDVKVMGNYQGDHAMLKESLNTTLDALNETLAQIAIATDQVNSGARQISDSSQALSQGASESASSMEEVTSSMQEVTSQVQQSANNAGQANQLASQARISAETGNEMMLQLSKAMNDISESSSSISKIIKTIEEIAFQTNLLSLNAAVEAARAGKYGKGFAVVAEEVRNLAQRSAKAAKETAEIIENSLRKTEAGVKTTEETTKSLKEIVMHTTKVTDLVGEIASASKEQAQGIEQINQGLTQVDDVIQSNTSSAEELASASEEMSGQTMQVKQMLGNFRLRQQASFAASGASPRTEAAVTQQSTHQAVLAAKAAGYKRTSVMTAAKAGKKDRGHNGKEMPKVTHEKAIVLDDEDLHKF